MKQSKSLRQEKCVQREATITRACLCLPFYLLHHCMSISSILQNNTIIKVDSSHVIWQDVKFKFGVWHNKNGNFTKVNWQIVTAEELKDWKRTFDGVAEILLNGIPPLILPNMAALNLGRSNDETKQESDEESFIRL